MRDSDRFMLAVLSSRVLSVVLLVSCLTSGVAKADTTLPSFGPAGAPERTVQEWVEVFRRAPKEHSFKGVLVISVPRRSNVLSSRIIHWAERGKVIERVETLNGDESITIREGAHVVGVFPLEKIARIETLQHVMDWSSPFATTPVRVAPHYRAVAGGKVRVIGRDADVVELRALDKWRLSYRIWVDAKLGLILKMQTLSPGGRVLEQREFLDLSFDLREHSFKQLRQEMAQLPDGYRVIEFKLNPVGLNQSGWKLAQLPSGFELVGCFQREGVPVAHWMQCMFSDGLSSASVFIERMKEKAHRRGRGAAWGAMHTVTLVHERDGGNWWLTGVGEVPTRTLHVLASSFERSTLKHK